MFKPVESLLVSTFVLMNKIGTRISVGENYQAQQPLVRDLPQHVAQIQMAQCTEEQDGSDSGIDD